MDIRKQTRVAVSQESNLVIHYKDLGRDATIIAEMAEAGTDVIKAQNVANKFFDEYVVKVEQHGEEVPFIDISLPGMLHCLSIVLEGMEKKDFPGSASS